MILRGLEDHLRRIPGCRVFNRYLDSWCIAPTGRLNSSNHPESSKWTHPLHSYEANRSANGCFMGCSLMFGVMCFYIPHSDSLNWLLSQMRKGFPCSNTVVSGKNSIQQVVSELGKMDVSKLGVLKSGGVIKKKQINTLRGFRFFGST